MPNASANLALDTIDLNRAIEVFVRGCTFTRSFTHPCLSERVRALWVARDAPRKGDKNYRTEEWIALGPDAGAVDAAATKGTRGRFAVCALRAMDEPDEPLRQNYRALGYRLRTTEAFMIHTLDKIPRVARPFPISRVRTAELSDRVAKANRSRLMLPEHLSKDSRLRLYAALDSEQPIGWLRSITVGDCTWVSSVYVNPKYRRRGIAKSLLVAILHDDRATGARQSLLLSSHTGAMLYPTVGYRQIGQLFCYSPGKTRKAEKRG